MGQRSEVDGFHAQIAGTKEAETAIQRHGLTKRHRRTTRLITLGHNIADHAGAAISREFHQGPALGFASQLPLVTAVVSGQHRLCSLALGGIIAIFVRNQAIGNNQPLLDNTLHRCAGNLGCWLGRGRRLRRNSGFFTRNVQTAARKQDHRR